MSSGEAGRLSVIMEEQQQPVSCCCGQRRPPASSVPPPPSRRGASAAQSKSSRPRHRPSVYFAAYSEETETIPTPINDELYFFDAEQEELPPEEEEAYPIVTTNYVPPKRHVSLAEPATMLRPPQASAEDEKAAVIVAAAAPPPQSVRRSHKMVQSVFYRRGTLAARRDLEAPRVVVHERGYPGQLDESELEQTQWFYRQIHKQPALLEIVYSFRHVEEEPYALCRYMRAVKFDGPQMVERLESGQEAWQTAKEHDFYRDIEQQLGAPVPLFLHFYPFTYHGNAKNGCPVCYIQAGKIDAEGMLCLSTVDQASCFYWNQFVHQFPALVAKAKETHPDFCRCESINVIDLSGMSRAQMSSEVMAVLKELSKIGNFFPETLHCMLLLNAPSWFAFVWTIIKGFIDPRTAKKIEVYSTTSKGQNRVLELIDADQVPSEFGGTGPAFESLLQAQGQPETVTNDSSYNNNPGTSTATKKKRHIARSVHLKRKETKQEDDLVQLQAGEVVSIFVHSRSTTGASVSAYKDGQELEQAADIAVRREGNDNSFSEDHPPTPFSVQVCKEIAGPGTFSVELKDVNDPVENKKFSYGYFVIVAVVE